jgi:hypothetical protein
MIFGLIAAAGLAFFIVVTFTRSETLPDGLMSGSAFKMMAPFVLALIVIIVLESMDIAVGLLIPSLITAIGLCATLGAGFYATMPDEGKASVVQTMMLPGAGLFFYALAASISLFFVIEFFLLRVLSLTRLGAVVRITYYEALLQPFTLIVLALGIACVAIFAFFPFFSFYEEAKTFRDVGMSFAFLFTLPVMIFASSKVVDEEIENRTMLTLMSKPIARWQVVIGKYLGVVAVSMVVIVILGIAVCASAYVRYFDDMRLDYITNNDAGKLALDVQNNRAIMALVPSLVLKFMQIATLAAVAVAISTRWGLAFNVTAICLLFVLANLTQFVDTLGLSEPWKTIVVWSSNVLPHLNVFDIDQRLVYGQIATAGDIAAARTSVEIEVLRKVPTFTQIWRYVAWCSAYGLLYIGAALSAGCAMFRTRELT